MPFTAEDFKVRLKKTESTEKSIAKTTAYIIRYRKFYKTTIDTLLTVFKKSKPEKKLTIIYILNHTLQEAKKTKPGLEKLFAKNLEAFFFHFGSDKRFDKKIYKKCSHVLTIWGDRDVLKKSVIATLKKLIADKSFRKKWHVKNKAKLEHENLFGATKEENGEQPGRSRSRSRSKSKDRTRSIQRERTPTREESFQQAVEQTLSGDEDDLNDLGDRNLFDDGVVKSKKLVVSVSKAEEFETQIQNDEGTPPGSPIPEENMPEEPKEPSQKVKKEAPITATKKSPRKRKASSSKASKKSNLTTNYSKILRTCLTSNNSIYHDLDWLDKVPEEISQLNDDYINEAVIKMNTELAVSPKIFAEKMTAVLKVPPSLDSETRTWLTKLPKELADPSKIDQLVEKGLLIQGNPYSDEKMQSALLKDIGKIFKDINEFKQYLTKYNKQLSQELVQRRDLGCYLQLLAKERKKSHKFYIDSIKNITKKQKRANENAEKIRLMLAEPKLPDVSNELPDLGQLFENDSSYKR